MKHLIFVLLAFVSLSGFAQDNIDANGWVVSSEGFVAIETNHPDAYSATGIYTSDKKTLVRANPCYYNSNFYYEVADGTTTIAKDAIQVPIITNGTASLNRYSIYVLIPSTVKYIAPNAFPTCVRLDIYQSSVFPGASTKYDLNGDGSVNVTDVGEEVGAVLNSGD